MGSKRMPEVGSVEKLKKDTLVAHVIGSSADKRNHLGRYKKAVNKPDLVPRCAKRMCSKPACLGGHVWIKDATRTKSAISCRCAPPAIIRESRTSTDELPTGFPSRRILRRSSRKWFPECSKTIFSFSAEIAKLHHLTLFTLSSVLLRYSTYANFLTFTAMLK